MKFLLCVALFCLLTTFIFAQKNKIDSLQVIVSSHQKEDTTKVILLNQLSEAFFYNYQFDEGLQKNKAVLALSEKLKYTKGIGLYWRSMAILHGNSDISFAYYWRAMRIFEKLKDKQAIKATWDYFIIFQDASKAKDSLAKAQQTFEKSEDKAILAEIFNTLAFHTLRQNKYEEALMYSRKALKMYELVANTQGQVGTLLLLKLIYEKQGNKEKVNENRLIVLRVMDKTEDKDDLAMGFYMLGEFYTRLNKSALAINYLLKCTQASKDNDEILRGFTLFSIGQLYHAQGYYKRATEYYYQVLTISEKAKNDPRLALITAYNFLGFSYTSELKLAEAMQYHLKAKAIAEKENNEFAVAQSLDGIGQVHLQRREYKEALTSFFQSFAIFDKFQKQWIFSFLNMHIAKCYMGLGDLRSSLEYGLKAYKLALQSSTAETEIKSSLLLADLYDKLGDYKQAYLFQKKYGIFKDSLIGQDNATQLAEIELEVAMEKQQQAIALLEKDKQLHMEENKNQELLLMSSFGALILVVLLAFALYRNNQIKQKSNQQLAKQKEEIQAQAEQLVLVNATKDKLFAIIGHDLRSPISSLKSLMDLTDDEEMNPSDFAMFSGNLKNSVEHIHFTLNNLLIWANSQMQGFQTKSQGINLQKMAQENFNLFEQTAKNKNISLHNHLPLHAEVQADADQINIVFRNLISNALKFTMHGGSIKISAEPKQQIW